MIKPIGKDNELLSQLYLRDKHFKDIRRKQFVRLTLTYILPFIILLSYFHYELNSLSNETNRLQLMTIAVNKSKLIDLFLKDKVFNLRSIIDAQMLRVPLSNLDLELYSKQFREVGYALNDIEIIDSFGNSIYCSDSSKFSERRNYFNEDWYKYLINQDKRHYLTDIQKGNSGGRYFNIALNKWLYGKAYIINVSIDADEIRTLINSDEFSNQYIISIYNQNSLFQISNNNIKSIINLKKYNASKAKTGFGQTELDNYKADFAYSKLEQINWSVIVIDKKAEPLLLNMKTSVLFLSIVILILLILIVLYRAYKIAQMQIEKDITRSQLEQASKLASIGELVSGIAHEINNPLAIIAAEVGLIKDMVNPIFNFEFSIEKMVPHLDNIHDATFRGRDITKKLLSFVRNDKIELKEHDINQIIDDVIDGFFKRELESLNIKIERYSNRMLPLLITEANQLKQVLINIINNAVDAITPPGAILIETSYDDKYILIAITDTGRGIKNEDMNKIFMPFFTTKDVGKGTGLGLSVSYGIIKNLGGTIEVESVYDTGTTFLIKFPN
jgi:two-component system NtrC family sensor kinase